MPSIDTTTVTIALAIVCGVLGLYLAGAPLLVRLMFRKPIEQGFFVMGSEDALIPEDALSTFRVGRAGLEPLGFVFDQQLRFDAEADLMDAYALVFVHPANRDLAMVLHCVGPVRLHQIEFSTELEDGTEINTNNGPQLPLNAVIKPGKDVYWFPDIDDPVELYRAHSALCAANSRAGKKVPPTGPALFGRIRAGMRDDYEYAVNRGIFRADSSNSVYRMTLPGAYRLTWPNIFPFNAYYNMRRRNQDRKRLARAMGR